MTSPNEGHALPVFPERFNLAEYYLFARLREGLGDRRAIFFGERAYTFGDVAERTEHLAAYLHGSGLRAEERVLVVLPDSPAFAVAFFATLAAGGVVAMGNPDAPVADLAYLLEYTRASCVVTIPRVAAALAGALSAAAPRALVLVPEVATGDDAFADLGAADAALVAGLARGSTLAAALTEGHAFFEREPRGESPSWFCATHRDDAAIWLFTSGSTGKSKAAMHAHRDFAFNTEVYAKRTVGYGAGDVTVSVPQLFFGYATGTNLMFPFAVGAATALFAERPTPESLVAAVERHAPTVVTNVPTMMSKLLEHDAARVAKGGTPLNFSSVRFHLSAGEALPEPLLRRFCDRFGGEVYDGIGSAEMFHIYCTNRPGDVVPGSLGKPVEGYVLRILAAEATAPGEPELPRNETGVMWVRGESVATGYYRDRDKSFQTFHGKWCRTGDLFRLDDAGYLWFSGRADDLLKVGGRWVAPVQVEEALVEHEAVATAAVIGRERDGLVILKAVVTLANGREPPTGEAARAMAEALREHLRGSLVIYKIPRAIAFVAELPKNDRGKVDRRELARLDAAGELPAGD